MILGIISIVAGALIIRFRKIILRENYSWQKENFGLNFGKKQFKFDEIICIVVGAVFIVGGLLLAFGVLDVRQ